MKPTICVYGLGHLGYVTAACLAEADYNVLALNLNEQPININDEPDLGILTSVGLYSGRFTITTNLELLSNVSIIWVTFDTPVDSNNHAHPEFIQEQLANIRDYVVGNTLIIISSQVPVGFTQSIAKDWRRDKPGVRFVYSPENLRHGHAIHDFKEPARVVIGLEPDTPKEPLIELFKPFCQEFIWTIPAAAEMTKHAINGFLAASATYANELSRLCDRLGVNYAEVERGLRSEPRIGPLAYVAARGPVLGSLLRDVEYLRKLNKPDPTSKWFGWLPLIDSIIGSNDEHAGWQAYVSER